MERTIGTNDTRNNKALEGAAGHARTFHRRQGFFPLTKGRTMEESQLLVLPNKQYLFVSIEHSTVDVSK